MSRMRAMILELLEVSVDDIGRRAENAATARAVTERSAGEREESLEEFRYRSICRLNILERPV